MTPTERNLTHALRALAATDGEGAPARLEQELLTAFRSQRRRKRVARVAWMGTAAAACLAGILGIFLMRTSAVTGEAEARPTETFYALPDADADAGAPLEYATVVRVSLPLSALRDVGLPVDEQTGAGRVQADLLLGHDGLARAVRFVQ